MAQNKANLTKLLNKNAEPSWKYLIAGFQDSDDRALAIIGGAFLEEELRLLVMAFLAESHLSKELLQNAATAAKMAFVLGLVNQQVFEDINCIRDIRNAAAHLTIDISFQTPEIKERCQALHIPKHSIPSLKADPPPRELFALTLMLIGNYLQLKRGQIKHEQRQIPDDMDLVSERVIIDI